MIYVRILRAFVCAWHSNVIVLTEQGAAAGVRPLRCLRCHS